MGLLNKCSRRIGSSDWRVLKSEMFEGGATSADEPEDLSCNCRVGDRGRVEEGTSEMVLLREVESQVDTLVNVELIMNDDRTFMERKTIHKWGIRSLYNMTANGRKMRWCIQVPTCQGSKTRARPLPPLPRGHVNHSLRSNFRLFTMATKAPYDLALLIYCSHLF